MAETHLANGTVFAKKTYVYDGSGNPVRIASWIEDDLWTVEHRQYQNGQFVKSVTQDGIETADGSQTAVTTQYTYDPDTGSVLSQTDGNGNITSFTYDRVGRILQETLPDGATRTYAYQDRENSLATCDAEGGKLEYRYTHAGLLSEVVNCATGRTLVSCTYDRSERLLTETDGNGTKVQYTYDAWGRITEKTVYSAEGELAF